jgi:hypothetical protein
VTVHASLQPSISATGCHPHRVPLPLQRAMSARQRPAPPELLAPERAAMMAKLEVAAEEAANSAV